MGLLTHTRKVIALIGLCVAAANAVAEVRTFDLPEYRGAALAYCSADGSLCGADLANSWCIEEGFQRASNWMLTEQAGVVASRDAATSTGRAFVSISCERAGTTFRAPMLGSMARSTVITPNRRAVESAISPVEFQVSVPGCHQREPGVFLCETTRDFQHCRSLYRSGRVFGCRAGLAFESGFADPIAAARDSYDLTVRSTAVATVRRERRGKGKLRGSAEFVLAFDGVELPKDYVCLQRDRYVYYPTGPMGGMAGIDATDDCDAPLRGAFEPNEDDLLRAYDMCSAAGAWGSEIEQPIELLVAGLYHVLPADSAALVKGAATFSADIIAPYVSVHAPMTVSCEQ
jgi:hypothetical protein